MVKKTLEILEFDKVLAEIATFTDSSLAGKQVQESPIYKDIKIIDIELNKVQEAYNLLYIRSVNPTFSVDNIILVLEKAKIFSTLTIAEIIKVRNTLRTARLVKQAIEREPEENTLALSELVSDIYVDKKLEDDIGNAVLSETELKDTASTTLYSIRRTIKKISENIRKKLNSYITSSSYKNIIQDNIVTIRNERFVIPIKMEHKGSLPGLIHDQSVSGQTLFVEPMEIVELNNDLKIQMLAEAEEQERILQAFTARIAAIGGMLEITFNTLIVLDIIFAKAKYANSITATRPILNNKLYISMEDARHPLISKNKVIPNNVNIGKGYNTLLITGPNTGGKTVYLKTVGLLQLMAQSGIFIPAKNAECGVFANIFCDIGDEQSIEQSLSTFSSHIVNIKMIMESLSSNSLVLLDELGAGTDPAEGAALAVAITDYVLESNARALITTHFSQLKEYALSNNKIESASMDFDDRTYSPTFKLLIGTPGSSNALNIAEKLGMPSTIIEKARLRQAPEKAELEKIIQELERSKRAALQAQEQAFWNLEKSKEELKLAKAQRASFAEKQEKFAETIQKEKKEHLKDTIAEAEDIVTELKALLREPSEQKLFQARKIVKDLKANLAPTSNEDMLLETEEGDIGVGDWVWVKPLGVKGIVEEFNAKKDEIKVKFSGISGNFKLNDCLKAADGIELVKKGTVQNQFSPSTVAGEIKLIGKAIDEGLYELGLYLDKAYLAGYGEVSIVHGVGSGRLRSAVQEYLKECTFVKSFRDGVYGEGERGVTIVRFR